MTDAELGILRQRNEERRRVQGAASFGPWQVISYPSGVIDGETVALVDGPEYIRDIDLTEWRVLDAEFVCAARNDPVCEDVAALMAMVEFQARLIHDLNEEHGHPPTQCHLFLGKNYHGRVGGMGDYHGVFANVGLAKQAFAAMSCGWSVLCWGHIATQQPDGSLVLVWIFEDAMVNGERLPQCWRAVVDGKVQVEEATS